MIKVYLEYLFKAILQGLTIIPSLLLFPIVYPFRYRAYDYTRKHGVMGPHPLQWCSWFFTKYKHHGDWFVGPDWYMTSLKEKYLDMSIPNDPIARTFKEKLIYFYIAYRWGAMRNYMWNFKRWLCSDGGYWHGADIEDIKVLKDTTGVSKYVIYPSIMYLPQLKFENAEGEYMNNRGDYIKYPKETPSSLTTLEGLHYGEFFTANGKKRFNFRYVKIIKSKLFKRFIHIELFFGWSYAMGWLNTHVKIGFKKFDNKSLSDYQQYMLWRKNLS